MDQTLPAPGPQPAALEERFLSSLPEIERVVRFVARRNRLSGPEEDDFASEVKLAMVEGGYRILGSFKGDASLRTYLVTVVQRLFLDYRRKQWGKWRPSAAALRLGPTAVRLDCLLHRDGLSLNEAIETLRLNLAVTDSAERLTELALALPPRIDRRAAGEEMLASAPAGELASPDVQLEGAQTGARIQTVIEELMTALPASDRVLLRLRFEDEIPVVSIARMLGLDQSRLYRRLDTLMREFRRSFEDRGLLWPDVTRMIDRGQCHVRLPTEPGPVRPSSSETQV